MSPPERDWDKELADIDKVIARTPASPAPGPGPVPATQGRTSAPALAAAPVGRKAALATWLKVILGVLLAVGMTQWPYGYGCGISLYLYMGAAAAVVVAGFWSSISSWKRRMGLAHTLALVVALWGMVLLAREILPRTGYAKQTLHWTCP
ncbi:MAG: hypothetical protein ABI836_16270 [Gemmatimonadota bacterium]